MHLCRKLILVSLLTIIFIFPCSAEIYKYKDANGKWQFSDSPPASKESKVEIVNTGQEKSSSENSSTTPPKNLAKLLGSAYPGGTPLEKTTLSVVSIKTTLGGGTGFFVSSEGYIVTNRHVVRPTTSSHWENTNEKFQNNLDELAKQKQNMERRQNELNSMSMELERYKKQVDDDSGNIKSIAHSEYMVYKNRYEELKKELKKNKEIYEKNKKKVDKQNKDFNFSSTLSRTTRRFEIKLKDNSVLHADLISLSKKHDLALLKLEGHITPFIDTNNSMTPSQGDKVYAIGSPLGLRDFVTSGIITNVKKDQIITDTQILPGNSGGPLIDTQGRVIGVNTLKLMAEKSIGSAGFGVAIPISIVKAEFADVLKP